MTIYGADTAVFHVWLSWLGAKFT